ncbi:MAG: hypothetical protein EPO31_07515 [Gammaproteobacteria bacterium]|nr:MAG: hypothetical protein EPO31_07515 [Gammaproteobacteria bacterium]
MTTRPPSQDQQSLAHLLDVEIGGDTFDVAAARVMDAVAPAIGYEPAEQSSERQREFAKSIGLNVIADSKRVASAKIGEALFAKNQDAIATLNLKPRDSVVRVEHFEHEGEMRSVEQEFIVSSIQRNGRVFFKGGNGQGAWPTQLRKHAG